MPPLLSLVAHVFKTMLLVPADVGVPVTVQLMLAPTATVAAVGTVGLHDALKPVGNVIAQVAPAEAGVPP